VIDILREKAVRSSDDGDMRMSLSSPLIAL